MNETALYTLAAIGALTIACQWLAWWVKLPAILFLLLAGIAAGPVFGVLDPEALFGHLLFPMVSLSVAVVLFEGSLTLKLDEIRGLGRVVRNLVTFGAASTWAITTLATRYFLEFSWETSFLFGAVMIVTGPTVIVPMLRTVRPNAAVSNVLRWEGIVIDPLGALLAVLVYEFIISGQDGGAFGHTLLAFGKTIFIGFALGALTGQALGVALRRHMMPEYLHNVATLTIMLAAYALSNYVFEESGLLTVTVMGMWIANMKNVPMEDIIDFKESLSVLLISALFIVLAARIEFSEIVNLGMGAVWVFVVIQFVARPFKAFISTLGSSLKWQERALIGWIAPRGIVAAAVSALFAIRLEDHGYPDAALLAPMTFIVIIGTVALQSATARLIARALGVAEPEPKGFLIIGANPVAREVARELVEKDFRVMLTDVNWDNISKARMEGLPTFYGHPVSEHADRRLDLVGIGRMLALSPQRQINALATMRYRTEFGRNMIYALQTATQKTAPERSQVAAGHRGRTLFGEDVTYSKLAGMISDGAEMRSTAITENFTYEDYLKKYGDNAVPMFALDPKGKLRVMTPDEKVEPKAGWKVLGLVKEGEEGKGKDS